MLYVGFVSLLLALAKTFHLYVKCFFVEFIENVLFFFAVYFLVTNRLSNCFVSGCVIDLLFVKEEMETKKEDKKNVSSSNKF